jgi:hypothetical protein
MNPDLSSATWFTSSHSSGGNDCVEVAHLGGGLVGVRDSKNVSGPALVFGPEEWDAFLARARGGNFPRP